MSSASKMAIRKGEDWGQPGPLPDDSPVVTTDAELARLITDAGGPANLPAVGVIGGDLASTLGSPGRRDRLYSAAAQTLLIDVGRAHFDGGEARWFVSHAIARKSWWFGPLLVVANSAWLGEWNIAPRAHPGDGRLDVLSTSMSPFERWKGRRRLSHGGHVPHPDVSVRRRSTVSEAFPKPLDVWLDGVRSGTASNLEIELVPEAITVVV